MAPLQTTDKAPKTNINRQAGSILFFFFYFFPPLLKLFSNWLNSLLPRRRLRKTSKTIEKIKLNHKDTAGRQHTKRSVPRDERVPKDLKSRQTKNIYHTSKNKNSKFDQSFKEEEKNITSDFVQRF